MSVFLSWNKLGCGAFGNPPEEVSEVLKGLVSEFDGFFHLVCFAILPNRRDQNPYRNYDCFKKHFGERASGKEVQFKNTILVIIKDKDKKNLLRMIFKK